MEVAPDGVATYTPLRKDSQAQRRQLSAEDVERLQTVLAEQGFWTLESTYGRGADDAAERALTVSLDGRAKTVRLQFMIRREFGGFPPAMGTVEGACRAIRIWAVIQGFVEDERAFDPREYDRLFETG
jgi:SOS-response transcriptional repressor LexA